jgi:hypothetical protein
MTSGWGREANIGHKLSLPRDRTHALKLRTILWNIVYKPGRYLQWTSHYTSQRVSVNNHVVAQLAEAICYNLESQWFGSRWCRWNISTSTSFRSHYGPGFDSASNRNEYQEYFLWGTGDRCVGLTLPPSHADCLEIWEPQPPGTLRACSGM